MNNSEPNTNEIRVEDNKVREEAGTRQSSQRRGWHK